MKSKPDNIQVVVTGMHRSNTSMVTESLEKEGLFIGENLLPASNANSRGYFEDVNIIAFHDKIIQDAGYKHYNGVYNRQILKKLVPSKYKPDGLLKKIFDDHKVFGFKDPRATLFLDYWEENLSNPVYMLCFRDPAFVAHSLLKRAGRLKKFWRYYAIFRYLNLWYLYNSLILEFYQKYPERIILLKMPEAVSDADQVKEKWAEIWKNNSNTDPILPNFGYYNKNLSNKKINSVVQFITNSNKKYYRLYEQLSTLYKQQLKK